MKISGSICFRGNDFATIKNFRKKFNENFFSTLFSRKWFCNYNKFSTKTFLMKIFGWTCFEEMILQPEKYFDEKFSMKSYGWNLFSRKWFCNHKKFSTKKLLMKIFGSNLFSRKWFCNYKKFSTKKFLMKF